MLSKPLPEGTKCLEPKEYRAPKPTEMQVLSMLRLMTTATNWSEFNAFPKDERLKTIKQLLNVSRDRFVTQVLSLPCSLNDSSVDAG